MLKHFQPPKKQWSIFLEVKGIINENGDIKSELDFLDKKYFENYIKGKYCVKIEDKYWAIKSGNRYIIDDFDGIDKFKEELAKEAIIDPLTRCFNKKEIEILIENSLKSYFRYGDPFCILMLDIDFFKKVNDTYGHLAGDFILKEVTKIIQEEIRKSDICGRFGGEEFIILLPNTKMNGAMKLSYRIKQSIESKDFKFNNSIIKISVSIGITSPSKTDSIFSLIERVDEALYEAKKKGRNRVEYR